MGHCCTKTLIRYEKPQTFTVPFIWSTQSSPLTGHGSIFLQSFRPVNTTRVSSNLIRLILIPEFTVLMKTKDPRDSMKFLYGYGVGTSKTKLTRPYPVEGSTEINRRTNLRVRCHTTEMCHNRRFHSGPESEENVKVQS